MRESWPPIARAMTCAQRRLADAGHVLDEQVAGREQAAQRKGRRPVDLDHRAPDLFPERMRRIARVDQALAQSQSPVQLAFVHPSWTIGKGDAARRPPSGGALAGALRT